MYMSRATFYMELRLIGAYFIIARNQYCYDFGTLSAFLRMLRKSVVTQGVNFIVLFVLDSDDVQRNR